LNPENPNRFTAIRNTGNVTNPYRISNPIVITTVRSGISTADPMSNTAINVNLMEVSGMMNKDGTGITANSKKPL